MKTNKLFPTAAMACLIILFSISKLAFADGYGTVESTYLLDGNTPLSDHAGETVSFDKRRYGVSVISVGDLDGNNVTDIFVANFAPYQGNYGTTRALVLLMNSDGTVKDQRKLTIDEAGLPDDCWSEDLRDSYLGLYEMNTFLGVMREGQDPVMIGVAVDENDQKGALYALSLKYNSDPSVSIVTACAKIEKNLGGFNPTPEDNYPDDTVKTYIGYPVLNAGDLDDDGFPDIYVGIDNGQNEDENINEGGGTDLYIFYMQQDDAGVVSVKSHEKITTISTEVTNNDIIDSMEKIELDGDPDTIELLLGTAGIFGTTANTVYVVSYNKDWTINWTQVISDDSGDFISGNPGTYFPDDTPTYRFGSTISVLGDIDGDTVPDIAVGAQFDFSDKVELDIFTGRGGPGAVYVLFMNRDGTVKSKQKISHLYGNLTDGDPNNDFMTKGLKFGGSSYPVDFNNDGKPELMVGDFDYNTAEDGSGVAYVLGLNTKPSLTSLGQGVLEVETPPTNLYHPSGTAYTTVLNFNGYSSMTDIIDATNGYISQGEVPLVIIRRGETEGTTMDIDQVTIPGGATFACGGETILSLYYDTDKAEFRNLQWEPIGKCPTQNYVGGARKKSAVVLEPNAHINGWNVDASGYTWGIAMKTAGTAWVTNTTVSNANSNGSDGRGIWATGSGTVLYVTDSKVENATEDGFRVNKGGTLILDNIETTDNRKNGILVGGRGNGGGNLVMTNSSSSGNKFGIMGANGFASINVSGSKIFSNDRSALELYGKAGGDVVVVSDSEIYDNNLTNAPWGSVAILGIANTTIRNTTIHDNNNNATGVHSESDSGYGDPPVATTLENVTITGNGTNAVVSRGDSTLTITSSTLDGNCSALADRRGNGDVGTITVDGVDVSSGACP